MIAHVHSMLLLAASSCSASHVHGLTGKSTLHVCSSALSALGRVCLEGNACDELTLCLGKVSHPSCVLELHLYLNTIAP
jgi:hypothetical protein